MKGLLFIILMVSVGLFTSCEKSVTETIQGRWSLISDSTIIKGGATTYTTYIGVNGDYFVFASDGNLYIKESSSYDTIPYQILSADSIILPTIGFSINGVTEASTVSYSDNRMRILANPPGNVITPGFQYQRIINLKR